MRRTNEDAALTHDQFIDLLEPHEIVDCLGQLGKTGDCIIWRNFLIRRIVLIVRDKNGFHPHLLSTEDIAIEVVAQKQGLFWSPLQRIKSLLEESGVWFAIPIVSRDDNRVEVMRQS